jgi:hypothetical protein
MSDGRVRVAEIAAPFGYPSSNPLPNREVAVLDAGDCANVFDVKYGKDFAAYTVRMQGGIAGFVISGDGDYHEGVCPMSCARIR